MAPLSGRLLIASGDPAIRDDMKSSIHRSGVTTEVDVASDGPSASSLLRSGGYDWALVDRRILEKHGSSIVSAVRMSGESRTTLILIEDEEHPDAFRSAISLGAADSVLMEELDERLLARLLTRSRMRQWISEESRKAERQTAEDELRKQAVILEHLAEGVNVSNTAGIIAYTNPAFDRMFGYGLGELLGQHVSVLNADSPEDNQRLVRGIVSALEAEGRWEGEFSNRRKDSSRFVTRARITAVKLSGTTHWISVQEDVTERKRAERDRKIYHDLLTHDVTNFTGALSGVLELLLEFPGESLAPRQTDLLRRANRQVFQLRRLAENTMRLARIREKGVAPVGFPVNLLKLLESTAETVRTFHFDRPLQSTIDCPEDLQVPGIPFLDSLFLNLLENVVRHTPEKEIPRCSVKVSNQGEEVKVSVRGGPPLDPRGEARVFSRFETSGESKGSGLGLTLVREIVEQTGGRVSVGSADGPDGPAFEVSITLRRLAE